MIGEWGGGNTLSPSVLSGQIKVILMGTGGVCVFLKQRVSVFVILAIKMSSSR